MTRRQTVGESLSTRAQSAIHNLLFGWDQPPAFAIEPLGRRELREALTKHAESKGRPLWQALLMVRNCGR